MQSKVYGPGIVRSIQDHWTREAGEVLGISPQNLGVFFDDFNKTATTADIDGWLSGVANTGAASFPTTLKGGVVQLTTGATASSEMQIYGVENTTHTPVSNKFYFACRTKITTATDAVAICTSGLREAGTNSSIVVGFIGALDASNFVIAIDGLRGAATATSMGVAKDTAWHTWEIWSPANGTYKARVDGGSVVSVTPAAAPTASMFLNHEVLNGATAAARTMQVDWTILAHDRE